MAVAHPLLLAALLALPARVAGESASELKARARVLVFETRYPEAEADYRRVLLEDPRDVEAGVGLARVLVRMNRCGEAEGPLRDLLERRPGEYEARLVLGDLLMRTDRPVEAFAEFDRATKLDPRDPRARMGRARALSATVSEERGRAEYASTASALADRVEQSPDDVELRLALATALLRIDDPEGALREYEEALRRAPDDCEAGLGRARVELRLGSVDVARAHLERLLVQHPGCAEGHGLLGSAELRAGSPPEAELAYARAVELDPWNPSYRLGLANSRLRRGDLAGARTASAEAETLDPKDVDVQDLKARLQAIPPGYRFALYTGLRADRLTHGRDDWMQETAHLGWHAREELELGAGFEHFRRYGEDDFQASVDGAWRVDDAWTLSSVLVYGGEAEVVAQESFELEVARRIGSSASAVLRWRHAWYAEDVQVDVYSPGVEVAFGPSTSVLARYYHVDESEGDGGDAGSLRLALFPEGTWRPRFEVGYGNEAVVSRSAQEPSRDTDVFALSAGLDWVCSQRTRIALTGDYEKHQSDYEKYGLSLGVTVGF